MDSTQAALPLLKTTSWSGPLRVATPQFAAGPEGSLLFVRRDAGRLALSDPILLNILPACEPIAPPVDNWQPVTDPVRDRPTSPAW